MCSSCLHVLVFSKIKVCASIVSSDTSEAVEDGRRGRPCHSCLCASENARLTGGLVGGGGVGGGGGGAFSIKHSVVSPESAQRS